MAEFLALPEDQGYRLELVDGSVVVSPAPGLAHQRLLMSAMSAFHAATPPEKMSVHWVNVKLSEERLLVPDLVVANWPGNDALYFDGADVLLVLEVLSPYTRPFDVVLKPRLYAESGIPFLLLADPPDNARLLELDGDAYREVRSSVGGVLTADRPFAFTLDLVHAR